MSRLGTSLFILAAAAVPTVWANAQAPNPKGYLSMPIKRGVTNEYYMEVLVGTPPQKEYLLVDTGSPTISFEQSSSSWCTQSTKPCAEYGTFDNLTSSTSRYVKSGFADALIDFGTGDFLRDTVSIGGVATPDVLFGYINNYGFDFQVTVPTATIFGLSIDCNANEAGCATDGPYILPQLKNASSIDRMAVSVYLGPDRLNYTSSELILGGAYDAAKIDGSMFTINMVDPHSLLANQGTNYVNVTKMEATINGNNTSIAWGSGSITEGNATLIDTGNVAWYLPEPIFNSVYAAVGSPARNYTTYTYTVDCKYRAPSNLQGEITVEFGAAGKIVVPAYRLITINEDGTCSAYIGNGGYESSPLGSPFLRSAYAIFDDENFTVTLGQAKYTSEKNIVSFPEGGFTASA